MSRHRRPVTLTMKQREQKLAFCIVAGAALILLAGWGLLWWVAGLADGVFSVLHFLAFVLGGLLGVTLLSIADREDGEE